MTALYNMTTKESRLIWQQPILKGPWISWTDFGQFWKKYIDHHPALVETEPLKWVVWQQQTGVWNDTRSAMTHSPVWHILRHDNTVQFVCHKFISRDLAIDVDDMTTKNLYETQAYISMALYDCHGSKTPHIRVWHYAPYGYNLNQSTG